jgi:hypothetical protein
MEAKASTMIVVWNGMCVSLTTKGEAPLMTVMLIVEVPNSVRRGGVTMEWLDTEFHAVG